MPLEMENDMQTYAGEVCTEIWNSDTQVAALRLEEKCAMDVPPLSFNKQLWRIWVYSSSKLLQQELLSKAPGDHYIVSSVLKCMTLEPWSNVEDSK